MSMEQAESIGAVRPVGAGSRAAWLVPELLADPSWIFSLGEVAAGDMVRAIRRAHRPGQPLIDYRRDDFEFDAALPVLRAAFAETRDGRGIALVRGLPRAALSEPEFELLTWAIGLHAGVPRPQGKATHYLSAVRDIGTVYRSGTGRGYSSNAELDFHTDGADVVALTCFNTAKAGGMSMVSSSVTAHNIMVAERPDLAALLHGTFHFSRQAEQAPDEAPFYPHPIFAELDGRLHSRWNRNRITSAQKLPGVPPLSAAQRAAIDLLDEILRRPQVMYAMHLAPGDMQLLNSHVTLHSRTGFEDHADAADKRLLFRLWLTPPDARALPAAWRPGYRSVAARTVQGRHPRSGLRLGPAGLRAAAGHDTGHGAGGRLGLMAPSRAGAAAGGTWTWPDRGMADRVSVEVLSLGVPRFPRHVRKVRPKGGNTKLGVPGRFLLSPISPQVTCGPACGRGRWRSSRRTR
ncbi:TauD/TfdA family dioxygenase [Dankookia sp. P2]|uniref:TauD/TfdA family dioxygenase n=1 Tax=Dankookia sp. P2 TaxID=3423955 RepID=UPI003D67F027